MLIHWFLKDKILAFPGVIQTYEIIELSELVRMECKMVYETARRDTRPPRPAAIFLFRQLVVYSIVKRFHAIVPLDITYCIQYMTYLYVLEYTAAALIRQWRRLFNFSGYKCGAYSGSGA